MSTNIKEKQMTTCDHLILSVLCIDPKLFITIADKYTEVRWYLLFIHVIKHVMRENGILKEKLYLIYYKIKRKII